MKQNGFSVVQALSEQSGRCSQLSNAIRDQLLVRSQQDSFSALLSETIVSGEFPEDASEPMAFNSSSFEVPSVVGLFSKYVSQPPVSIVGIVLELKRKVFSDIMPNVINVSPLQTAQLLEWSAKIVRDHENSVLVFVVAAMPSIALSFTAETTLTISVCEDDQLSVCQCVTLKIPLSKSGEWKFVKTKITEELARRPQRLTLVLSVVSSSTPFISVGDFAPKNNSISNEQLVDIFGYSMSFYVALTSLGIFGLIGLLIFGYFRLFRRLVIEIVDNRHSFASDSEQSNFVQNAVLFAYRPVLAPSIGTSAVPQVITSEDGFSSTPVSPKVAPAPGRPMLGVLGSPANAFAVKFGVRVIAINRYVWRPPPKGTNKREATNDDDSDEADYGGGDVDMTKEALGAFNSGDSRYIVGVVVSEAPTEAQLNYPSPLCEQLRAAGFTQFCALPPLKTALRLRYAAGRRWRTSSISRMATAVAGLRFLGSSREVIRQYQLKPPRSPIVVEFYDPSSAIFYLPLADDIDFVDSRYLTTRLPPELTCPLPPPEPLPEGGGLLGTPPLPYKNMNAILKPWDPYTSEDRHEEPENKDRHGMERA